MEINLNPVGREEIHKLEVALLLGTLFRKDVIEMLRDPTERLTWIDTLAVAAAALARSKAGMTASQIAEDIGRTEATIRNHLQGKSKAGKLVLETYEKFLKEGVKLEGVVLPEDVEKLKEELKKKEEEINKLKEKLKKIEELVKTSE